MPSNEIVSALGPGNNFYLKYFKPFLLARQFMSGRNYSWQFIVHISARQRNSCHANFCKQNPNISNWLKTCARQFSDWQQNYGKPFWWPVLWHVNLVTNKCSYYKWLNHIYNPSCHWKSAVIHLLTQIAKAINLVQNLFFYDTGVRNWSLTFVHLNPLILNDFMFRKHSSSTEPILNSNRPSKSYYKPNTLVSILIRPKSPSRGVWMTE